MTARAAAIGLVSVVLAALSFFAAAGNMRGGGGALARLSPLPTDGLFLQMQGSTALASVEASAKRGEPVSSMRSVVDAGLAAAQRSFRREPLFVENLRNIVMLRTRAGETSKEVPLMLLTGKFSRRDPATNLLLAQYYGNRGDIGTMLEWLDRSLRTSTTASELMIPVLLQAAQDPRAVGPLINLLGRNPPWQDEFWSAIEGANKSYVNLAKVRTALHEQGRRLNPQFDESLMMLLAGEGRFSEAYKLASVLPADVHSGRSASNELVTNPGFADVPTLPPFGWQLSSTSEIDVYIDPATNVLHFETFGGSGGTVARQLVKTPRPRVHVSAAFVEWTPENNGAIFASLQCATPGDSRAPAVIELDRARVSRVITLPASDCPYHWLNIDVRPRDDRRPVQADLDSISLQPED